MNNIVLSIIISVLPVVVLCKYIYDQDKYKEPKYLLIKLFVIGMITIIPTIIIELFLQKVFTVHTDNIISFFINTLISVAIVEELSKWIVVKSVAYNNKEFDHIYDIIVYSVFTSLGFALIENIIYVLNTNIGIGIFRAIVSIPIHACCGIIMGYFLGKAKVSDITLSNRRNRHLIFSLLVPTITHTLYDTLLFSHNDTLLLIFIFFVIYTYISSLIKVKKLSNITCELKDINSTKVLNIDIIDKLYKKEK